VLTRNHSACVSPYDAQHRASPSHKTAATVAFMNSHGNLPLCSTVRTSDTTNAHTQLEAVHAHVHKPWLKLSQCTNRLLHVP
jgi:hypothetical protein